MPLLTLYLLLFWLSGYSIVTQITGPTTVNGLERGSLTVQCVYRSGWETYLKWWCRGAIWRDCKILVKTSGSEQEVKRDRVSIKDNQKNRTFTVTMEDLMKTDADTYWCGIEKTGNDLGVTVQVTIDPAPVTQEETSSSPTLTGHHLDNRHKLLKLSVLLPLIFTILLLLLVAASLLAWRMMKYQQKAAGMSPEQVLQPLEGDLCYADLTLQLAGTSPQKATTKLSSAQVDQVEVEYVTMASLPKEDISYASLTLGAEDQEPTYCNMGHLSSHLPGRGPEEPTEYSTISRP
ncbi:CMRF35-like molecule 1 isoform 1 precursor [Homo sapiens]|uniref:CMRF35-like molecule 1 n=1 Tax=Homo sapiens TaxID=9606 RepID=CLM1_HUMAN|nr:CMRF35-like molecule 1 isoform 1 precursor [Homo sapiens]Q8TDQ1.3 RecName: Full=CMRF35-like molecule 1; Short=CLM-1; AltName: Full=CD300 antigen-like family member F; AltName: Full=Immune receptor expressed on myeloid cells 1; Short=IREM-1; AltName: Full=Immunoglobulin superfamily member 13; Short=IgSF13; AltName: Full=NK inhibitory receptor; AltName: CD_antigen=CD300f; Flags: Precursor [Homo sapiens]EAW89184.1 CD300 antigen like family member F, isoform CRA_a [Homo sapiens]|eukprot:NP_620587.2 CMRF35-like molecule 1 isoform 1 precursor [Homo sapiens]